MGLVFAAGGRGRRHRGFGMGGVLSVGAGRKAGVGNDSGPLGEQNPNTVSKVASAAAGALGYM